MQAPDEHHLAVTPDEFTERLAFLDRGGLGHGGRALAAESVLDAVLSEQGRQFGSEGVEIEPLGLGLLGGQQVPVDRAQRLFIQLDRPVRGGLPTLGCSAPIL